MSTLLDFAHVAPGGAWQGWHQAQGVFAPCKKSPAEARLTRV